MLGTATVSIVVAMTTNRVIGKDGELPFHLPSDLARFRRITGESPLIMGRATFEEILRRNGAPLPGRLNIVLTKHNTAHVEHYGGTPAKSFDTALRKAIEYTGGEIFVIGGERVFREALPIARRMYVTIVNASFSEANSTLTHFPTQWRVPEWRATDANISFSQPAGDEYPSRFCVYERIPANGAVLAG